MNFNASNFPFADRAKALSFGAQLLAHSPRPAIREKLMDMGLITRAQAEGSNPAGGFTVSTSTSPEIQEAFNISGVFRQHAKLVVMNSDKELIAKRTSRLTASYTAESVAASESDGTYAAYLLVAAKLLALMRASSELNEDAIANLGTTTLREVVELFSGAEDDAGFIGDGTAAYGGHVGICNEIISGQHTASAITAAANHDTFRELDEPDIASMMEKLPERWWPTAKFFCSSYAMVNLFARLGATVGGLVSTTSGPRPQMTYQGIPIIQTPRMPGSGDQSGKAMILFGDLAAAATIGIRRDMNFKVLSERYADYDQVGFLCSHRFNIVVHELGNNTTAGPITALVGN